MILKTIYTYLLLLAQLFFLGHGSMAHHDHSSDSCAERTTCNELWHQHQEPAHSTCCHENHPFTRPQQSLSSDQKKPAFPVNPAFWGYFLHQSIRLVPNTPFLENPAYLTCAPPLFPSSRPGSGEKGRRAPPAA